MADRGAVAKLLEIEDLRVEFRTHAGLVKAVDGISYGVEPGETVALAGESGIQPWRMRQAARGMRFN